MNTNIIQRLKDIGVFYLEADKSNKMVILDEPEYLNRIRKLNVTNPIWFPRLYGLPKVHKLGSNMLPIVSTVISPT